MRYCRKCGNRLDDFDSYCTKCGAKVEERDDSHFYDDTCKENVSGQRAKVEDKIENIADDVSQNSESFLCLLLGILSLTCGTFICGIVSLVFYKKAIEKGQDKVAKYATFCKVGRICSLVSIILTVVGIVLSAVCWIIALILGLSFI